MGRYVSMWRSNRGLDHGNHCVWLHPSSNYLPGKNIVVTKEGVTKLLKGLNPSKALGPDELHPRVLKELATELGPVFAHLFQQSIDKGEIPKELFFWLHCSTVQKGR